MNTTNSEKSRKSIRTLVTSHKNLRALIESSMLVAIGFILSSIGVFKLPYGGRITILSMLPIIMIGIRNGAKWGIGSALVYSSLQILQEGLYPPIYPTALAYIVQALLDYILAFSVLGLSAIFKRKKYGLVYGSILCISLRFLCHFASGIIIWSETPWAISAWIYSLTYNGAYMGPELIATTTVSLIICKSAVRVQELGVRS